MKISYEREWAAKSGGWCRSRTDEDVKKDPKTGTFKEENIIYTYECQPEPAPPKTAEEIAAELQKKWVGKTCADQKVEADKTECTAT